MRILIVNPFGIGDVLFSTPLISNLKVAYPESYIGYICNIRAKDVLYNNSQTNEVFVFEKDEYRNLWKQSKFKCIKKFILFLIKIKKKRFDLVIDLSLGHQYSLFFWLIGIKKRVGYNYRNRGRFLTHKINITGYEDKPIADYYLDLLKFLNIKPKPFNLTMDVSVEDRNWADEFFKINSLKEQNLIVGIVPAGGTSWGKDFSYRHWLWKNYAKLAERLNTELDAKIIIFGDVSEQSICRRIQDAIQKDVINMCGRTSLRQFAALLPRCNLVVCNDGGPLHVAVSQDVRTVSIFGPVNEKVYGPYPAGPKHTVIVKNIDCRPCYRKFKLPVCTNSRRCLLELSVDEVFKEVFRVLSKNETLEEIGSERTQEGKMESVNCNLCGSNKPGLLFVCKDMLLNTGQFRIVRCKNCGLIYLNPRPIETILQQYYPPKYYSYQPAGHKKRRGLEKFFLELNRRIKDQILREYFNYGERLVSLVGKSLSVVKKIFLFLPYLRLVLVGRDIRIIPYQGQGRILDIGCGSGRALGLLRERGWDTYGVEINSQAVHIARDKLNLKVQQGDISKVNFQSNFFDVVIMTHTLEHMVHPKETLKKVNKILKRGGTLIVTVPNVDSFEARYFGKFWVGWDPPRHLHTFSLKTLKKILQAIGGFKIKRIKYELGTYILRESLRYKLRERFNYNLRDSRLLEFVLKMFSSLLGYLRKSSIIIAYITKIGE